MQPFNDSAYICSAAFSTAAVECDERMSKDLNNIDHLMVMDMVFEKSIEDFSNRGAAILNQFETNNNWPSLKSLVLKFAERLDIDQQESAFKTLKKAAVLGDIPNNLPFHGNPHFKKVLLSTMRQIVMHDRLCSPEARLTSSEKCLLMAAACIHDVGHDGKGNMEQLFRLEQQALDISVPFLKEGDNQEWLDDLNILVLCTDVSNSPNADSPLIQLKQAYKHYVDGQGNAPDLMEPLARLKDNPRLCRLAMMFEEADLMPSLVFGYERSLKENRLVAEEIGTQAGAPFMMYFVDNIFCGFTTPEGKTNSGIAELSIAPFRAQLSREQAVKHTL